MYGTYFQIMNKIYFNVRNAYLQDLLLILGLHETSRK
jgi:hypothetical protein